MGYLQTQGTEIVDEHGAPVHLAGVNWYGCDCESMVPGGLDRRTIDDICGTIADLGFNSIRVPFSVQLVLSNPPISTGLDAVPSLHGKPALDIVDAVIEGARAHGLSVVLANLRSDAGWSLQGNGLWYTKQYPEEAWLSAWTTLVERYGGNDTVIGCDLRNEPGSPPMDPDVWPQNGGALWGYGNPRLFGKPRDWADAAERAGNVLLEINPQLLIFVEGVRYDPAGPLVDGRPQLYWPGGNLTGVGKEAPPDRPAPRPITLNVPNRLVYSVHDYGPDMYGGLLWCQLGSTASTPYACRSAWNQGWGFIVREGIAPVWLGEFGTVNGFKPGDRTTREDYVRPNDRNAQGAWFTYLVDYMRELGVHWCYWALNGTQSPAPGRDPRRPDWYGLLAPNWTDIASEPLLNALQSMQ